jgi:hypothetical protein
MEGKEFLEELKKAWEGDRDPICPDCRGALGEVDLSESQEDAVKRARRTRVMYDRGDDRRLSGPRGRHGWGNLTPYAVARTMVTCLVTHHLGCGAPTDARAPLPGVAAWR